MARNMEKVFTTMERELNIGVYGKMMSGMVKEHLGKTINI